MRHLYDNLLCAVAARSTGYEMMEMAVVPLDAKLQISKKHLPCNLLLKPDYPRKATCARELLNYALLRGIDRLEAADLFLSWFEKLKLRDGKQIMVLTHNWPRHRLWFVDWLQYTTFTDVFHQEVRDIQSIGLWHNDVVDRKNEPLPFPKVALGFMAARVKADYVMRLPTVIDEVQAIAAVYRALVYQNLL